MPNLKEQAQIQIYQFTTAHDAHVNIPGVLRPLGGGQIMTLSGPVNSPNWLDLKNNEAQVMILKNNQWVKTGVTADDGEIYSGDDARNGDIKSTVSIQTGDTFVVFYGGVFYTTES